MLLNRTSIFAAALLLLQMCTLGSAQAATAAPTLNLYSVPSVVWDGNNTTVHWSATDATACTASGDWSGSFGASGTQFETALHAAKTYTMTCTGAGGTVTKSFPVKWVAHPPTISLIAAPWVVWTGNNTTIEWSSQYTTSCTASGDWSGAVGVSGSQRALKLTQNQTYTLTCAGEGGNVSKTFTVTVTPKPTAASMPTVAVSATPTTVTAGSTATLTWNATNATACAASGGFTATGLAATGTKAVANITQNTTFTMNCTNTAGSTSKSTVVLVQAAATTPPVTTPAAGAVTRPSYNTGDGFFVANGKLYDPDGLEYRIRGVNRAHYDSNSAAGLAKSGANTVRVFVGVTYGQTWPGLEGIMQNDHVAHQEMPIPTINSGSWGVTTCSSDNAMMNDAVTDWVNNAKTWTALNRYMAINIANEWGPSNSTVWRDQYIAAIAKMRAAGYLSPLVIDSGGCGQDMNDLLNYAAAVFNADPQKNIIFSFHLYGNTATADMAPFFAKLNALQQSSGMVFVVGEFGPGKNIGPSPTMTTPAQVITAAESNNLGWMAWAWDDNNLSGCASDDTWFSMTYLCGEYAQTSDLTLFGQDVVLNSTYGLQKLAKKANW